jgi:hypothetical protein
MTSLPNGEHHANGLTQVLKDVPPVSIRALTDTQQQHLARLVQGAIDSESAELVTAALARLDRVPRSLRRPLMKFLKL